MRGLRELPLGADRGICPITRCAKGLLNSPCRGYCNRECQVDPEKDCAWHLIIKRLLERGRLDVLEEILPQEPSGSDKAGEDRRTTFKGG